METRYKGFPLSNPSPQLEPLSAQKLNPELQPLLLHPIVNKHELYFWSMEETQDLLETRNQSIITSFPSTYSSFERLEYSPPVSVPVTADDAVDVKSLLELFLKLFDVKAGLL